MLRLSKVEEECQKIDIIMLFVQVIGWINFFKSNFFNIWNVVWNLYLYFCLGGEENVKERVCNLIDLAL
jgi:hypothetical protein